MKSVLICLNGLQFMYVSVKLVEPLHSLQHEYSTIKMAPAIKDTHIGVETFKNEQFCARRSTS